MLQYVLPPPFSYRAEEVTLSVSTIAYWWQRNIRSRIFSATSPRSAYSATSAALITRSSDCTPNVFSNSSARWR